MKNLFILIAFFTFSSCMGSYKVLRNGRVYVVHRSTGVNCEKLWETITEDYEEEGFGQPRDVMVRRQHEKIPDRQSGRLSIHTN